MTQPYYCEEKLDVGHYQGLNGWSYLNQTREQQPSSIIGECTARPICLGQIAKQVYALLIWKLNLETEIDLLPILLKYPANKQIPLLNTLCLPARYTSDNENRILWPDISLKNVKKKLKNKIHVVRHKK